HAVLGVEPEVITGRDEAELSFAGAVAGLTGVTGPLLVADIGGGSTELVRGGQDMVGSRAPLGGEELRAMTSSGRKLSSFSMDVGCVRMTERHLRDDPPTAAQIDATVADVRVAVTAARVDVPLDADATLVGVAGTVTTIAAIALGLDEYDADRI